MHPHTATPGWRGERLDVGWAIDVLHPLASTPVDPSEITRLFTKYRGTFDLKSTCR